jgi:hypothetical protein
MTLDRSYHYYPRIISHLVEQKENTVGTEFFILNKDNSNTTLLSYGLIRNKGRIPDIHASIPIPLEQDEVCFDAALFLDQGLAIVDCAKKGGKVFSTYTNYWYVVDLTSQTIKKKIQNDLYIGFTDISKRKLLKFTHPEAGGFTYLLRSYLSDGVDAEHGENTYMEIFLVPVEDPTDIQPLSIIDRTFLNLNSLRIMDAQIYLDDIFVLDFDTGLWRLDILLSQRVQITGRYRDYGFVKFGVYSDDYADEVIIALANKHTVYEIDWHKISQPTLINKYSLMENSTVKQVMLNDKYLMVQSSADAKNDTHTFKVDYTWVFTKGSRTYLNAYHVINHNSSIVDIDFDRENSQLFVAEEEGLALYQLD